MGAARVATARVRGGRRVPQRGAEGEVPVRPEPRGRDQGELEGLCQRLRKARRACGRLALSVLLNRRHPHRARGGRADSCGSTFARFARSGLAGFFGRTSRERSQARMGRTSDACSEAWMRSGTVWHGGYLTRSSSAWPSDASVSFLSDALETREVPARYYLSPTACLGILRRAERRGRSLPPQLEVALRAQASSTSPEAGQTA